MEVEHVVSALQGFSSAYAKFAPDTEAYNHEIRIKAVKKGSTDLLLDVIKFFVETPVAMESVRIVFANTPVAAIIKYMQLVRHIEGKPYETKPAPIQNNQSQVAVTNSNNATVIAPIILVQMLDDKSLRRDVAKIVRPLMKGAIDSAKISAEHQGEKLETEITVEDKPYFETGLKPSAETKEVELRGHFVSMNKSTHKGVFVLNDGTRISYELAKSESSKFYQFYQSFGYKEPVKILATAELNEHLKPVLLTIYNVEKTQSELPEKKKQDGPDSSKSG